MLNKLRNRKAPGAATLTAEASGGLGMLPEEFFLNMLRLERKRTERSGRRFVLMLLEPGSQTASNGDAIARLLSAVAQTTRATDLKGWFREGEIAGVIFTEIGDGDSKAVVGAISRKVAVALYGTLPIAQLNAIRLSFHVFPEDWERDPGAPGPDGWTFMLSDAEPKRAALWIKRLIDIGGSLAALALTAPLWGVIALLIKATSKGPVLYRQTRVGQYGRMFTFLKFRSMYVNSDAAIHQEYVARFIAGAAEPARSGRALYKIGADPRVTTVGHLLRKTSLDELPQLIQVLKGEMSLVGPRPPIPYEVKHYALWHRRRLLSVKPGITGLWQVHGRSRVKFDDMVRLDIRYAKAWSLWLDVKILLRTPLAVFMGEGAC